MVMMTLELVPPRLRGWLTRWLTEITAGVYVGHVSALVRDLLWEQVVKEMKAVSRAVLVYKTNNEQGFAIRMFGDSRRKLVDVDGLQLVANQHAAWLSWKSDDDDDPADDD